jgi:hypothetical protein
MPNPRHPPNHWTLTTQAEGGNLRRWPKGQAPFKPGAAPPEYQCDKPGCRQWRTVGKLTCYWHGDRKPSEVRQRVAQRKTRQRKALEEAPEREARATLRRVASQGLPEGLRTAPAWLRALALPDDRKSPRTRVLAALVTAWGNPEAWPLALDLLAMAERGEVANSGGDTTAGTGGKGWQK